jgi:hypothetical protein
VDAPRRIPARARFGGCPASQAAHYLTPVQFGSFTAVAEDRVKQLHLRLA